MTSLLYSISRAMTIAVDAILHLLHDAPSAVLATHSTHVAGYPFATALPCATDERHCPILLMSQLAEHTKNVLADPRCSVLVVDHHHPDVLAAPRMTVMGEVARIDASPLLASRYLRYHPEAETYLALGDFTFFRLVPTHIRYIGGFGDMAWTNGATLRDADVLTLAEEADCLQQCVGQQAAGVRLLGIDRYGIDIERHGKRERQRFTNAPVPPERIDDTVKRIVIAL
jgi:heme iron utilization protein